jgi:hypothetical protein
VGRLGLVISGGSTIVRGSTDTHTAVEFELQLTGLIRLSPDDCYL